MRAILLLVAIAPLLITSCSSDEEYGMAAADKTIAFSTYVGNNTRAVSKTTFDNGDVIGLYACRTTGDYAGSFTDNFMSNVAVAKGETEWTYSPVTAWPADENEHISFVAFYPRSETSANNGLTYSFTTSADLENQTDPMWCTVKDANINDRNGTAINGSATDAAFEAASGSVPLKFTHMLSKVNIKIKLNSNYPGITAKLNSMELGGISKSGKFTIANDLSSGSWSASTTKESIDLLKTTDEPIELTTDGRLMGEILTIPQALTGTTNAYINISYTHTLAEGGEKTVSKTIYLGDSWACNKVYNYVVNVSLDVNNITLSADVSNWDSEAKNPEIGATTEAPEPVDLGLSVKWSSCDFGTVSPYVLGPKFICKQYYNMTFDDTWGPNWSIPTREQWRELFNNCTKTQSTVNGIDGYLFTASNGNSIFLTGDIYLTSEYKLNSYTSNWYYYAKVYNNDIGYDDSYYGTYPIRPVFK